MKLDTAQFVRAELAAEAMQHTAATDIASQAVDNEVTMTATEMQPCISSDHDYSFTATASTCNEQSVAAAAQSLFGDDEIPTPSNTLGDISVSSVDDEIGSFFREARLPRKQCPLEWWKANEARYKCLVPLAVKYLCIPGSSAASERTFSVAGLTVNRLRSALSSEHVDMLVVMHANSDLFQ